MSLVAALVLAAANIVCKNRKKGEFVLTNSNRKQQKTNEGVVVVITCPVPFAVGSEKVPIPGEGFDKDGYVPSYTPFRL